MREVRRVRWLFCGLLLANPFSGSQVTPQLFLPAAALAAPASLESGPVYLRLESGTWAIGGVGDLAGGTSSLTLMPDSCIEERAVVEVGVGFVIEEEFSELEVAGTVKASKVLGIDVHFRNRETGACDFFRSVESASSSFRLQAVPVDSGRYRDGRTSEVEICLAVRSTCGPPPTDEDAVSVQDLSIGREGGSV